MVGKLVKAVAGGSAATKIKEVKTLPAEAPATPMPDADAEKRAAMQEELMRRKTGRASTDLTSEDDKL